MLLRFGADISLRNRDGKLPRELTNEPAVLELLREGADRRGAGRTMAGREVPLTTKLAGAAEAIVKRRVQVRAARRRVDGCSLRPGTPRHTTLRSRARRVWARGRRAGRARGRRALACDHAVCAACARPPA